MFKKDIEFKFTDECKQAFDQLKTALTNYPVLRQADPAKPFLLFTDASGVALGAILSQQDEEGNDYVCAYASRILRGAEVHYGITEKEALAMVWGIKYFNLIIV